MRGNDKILIFKGNFSLNAVCIESADFKVDNLIRLIVVIKFLDRFLG